jgi:predicted  nucleic acid-binding Zn-ribbon protein
MINKHKLEYADQRCEESSEDENETSGTDLHVMVAAIQDEIEALRKRSNERETKLLHVESLNKTQRLMIDEMAGKMEELEALRSTTSETNAEIDRLRGENIVLSEKVNELEMLLKEFNQRLSEAS